MKIVHIAKHCRDANGNVNVAIDLACAQAAAGHEVVFASDGGVLEPLVAAHGVAICRTPQHRGTFAMLRHLVDFVRFCRRTKPDVIHAHMVVSAIFGFVAARLCGCRLVTTVHNSFDKQSVLMRLGDAVVAVSQAEKNLLLRRGFNPEKLVCILNGPVGSVRETLAADTGEMQTPSIIMVCGLHARKGVADMLAAFAEISPAFPRWHLNIIGSGPDKPKLEREIADRGLTRAHLLGSVPHPKRWLERSAIFVTCSYAEPFALSTLEARGAGCALIGTRVGGTPEALAFGEAGLLFEAGDRATLKAHLTRLMADEAELDLWRQRARAGSSGFEIGRMASDHIRLYDAVTSGALLDDPRERQVRQFPTAAGSAMRPAGLVDTAKAP